MNDNIMAICSKSTSIIVRILKGFIHLQACPPIQLFPLLLTIMFFFYEFISVHQIVCFTLQNTVPLKSLRESFNSVVLRAGLDARRITHHCNRAVSDTLVPLITRDSKMVQRNDRNTCRSCLQDASKKDIFPS